MSLIPLKGVPLPNIHYGDKVVHFFIYFVLVLVWLIAYPFLTKKRIQFLALVVIWGIAIEFMQEYLVDNRTGDIFDALANTAGAIFGFVTYVFYKNK